MTEADDDIAVYVSVKSESLEKPRRKALVEKNDLLDKAKS